ncbi:shikimate dehydrogenase family protein [Amaricoccus solimangrovi]|uniref:Shikimate dehydrogenase n=1 Tax=Amaricoccus solimangrovi TaxID=2589815 RepID=A0A501WRG0_9RHOB|nr:shikimate dehydrogenase [Amaricoccus solimangrovi]TPE49591.1 shikimate dehydrogenase [Amaricoccus solimangrovi]
MTTTATTTVKLGLIGDNIADSRSPRLHELAGDMIGRPTTYDRLVPKTLGLDFDAVFDKAREEGYRGLNITYPYKERVTARVTVDEPQVARLGACNTVLFTAQGAKGFNTDWSGFKAAYRTGFGDAAPGTVCMIGAGGVGKAVAFGLADLGMRELRLVERDLPKAEALAEQLRAAAPGLVVGVSADPAAARGADGLVNCTPVGMVGYGGTPLPRALIRGASWAFDAVYTPVDTEFLGDAAAEGLKILSGYELYFYQGLHAISIFHGIEVEEARLRALLTA